MTRARQAHDIIGRCRIWTVIAPVRLHLLAAGPTLPLTPPEYTNIEASLPPHPVGTAAGGLYRGTASARRQALEAVGTVALVADAPEDGQGDPRRAALASVVSSREPVANARS